MKNVPTFSPSKLIEKYRWPIGVGLLVLILFLGGYLLWRENYWKAGEADRIKNSEYRIEELEDKVAELEKTKTETQSAANNSSLPTTNQPTDSGTVAGASTTSTQPALGKININTATAAELDSLPGIGSTIAGYIIEYRQSHGGFKTIEEIMQVKKIKQGVFNKIKDQITI